MEQESLKQLLKDMIYQTENNNITTIQDMIQLLATEIDKTRLYHNMEV